MADKDKKLSEGRIDTAIIPARVDVAQPLGERPTKIGDLVPLRNRDTSISYGRNGLPLGERETRILGPDDVGKAKTLVNRITPAPESLPEFLSDDAKYGTHSGSVFELPIRTEKAHREPRDVTRSGLCIGGDGRGAGRLTGGYASSPNQPGLDKTLGEFTVDNGKGESGTAKRDTLVNETTILGEKGPDSEWFKKGDEGLEELAEEDYGFDENITHRRRVIGAFSVLGALAAIGLGYILTSSKPAEKTYDFKQIERKGLAVYNYDIRKGDTSEGVVNAFNKRYTEECRLSVRNYHLYDNTGKPLYRIITDPKTHEIYGTEDIGAGEYFRTGGKVLQIRFSYYKRNPSPCVDPIVKQRPKKTTRKK